ncbi:MAG: class I SAM-dependent methyltransferase [Caulobacteraceae bacterium]
MTPDHCDFCGSDAFDDVYSPIGSLRQVKVAVCRHCGLAYSRYADVPYSRDPRPSGDADWGNIRWAKGFRLDALRPMLTARIEQGGLERVLDVGANRGSFLEWLLDIKPDAQVTAVEPDGRVVTTYQDRSDVDVRIAKLEHAALEPEAYDFAYCCQTLEHADSPAAMIASMHAALKTGGTLFIEVPNIEVISYPLTIEEFFIDKHTAHFSHRLLTAYIEWSGFRLEEGTNAAADILNVRIFATKVGPQNPVPFAQWFKAGDLPAETRALIETYGANVVRNREALPKVVETMHMLMARQNVALWGATTIFDLLVKYGGLDTSKVRLLVDSYVYKYLPEHHGVKPQNPSALRVTQPDVCIVLARFSTEAITESARKFGVRNIIGFSDLLHTALSATAA